MQAAIRDETVFAKQIEHDPFRNTPGSRLLTGSTRQGRPARVRGVLRPGFGPGLLLLAGHRCAAHQGDQATAGPSGFSARSAFLNAPGFGGISWLAHSTLQSGVWANTGRRYNQLVSSDRFTLSDAFNRAGWRTINVAPADDRPLGGRVVLLPLRQAL